MMRRVLGLLVVLGLLAGGVPAQIPKHSVGAGTDLRTENSFLRWFGSAGLPLNGLEALYTMGPDGGLNSGAKWYDRAENLLVWSEDLSEWNTGGTPVVTATTVEDDDGAVYEYITQTVASPDARVWTRTVWVLKDAIVPATRFPEFIAKVNAAYKVRLDTSSGATSMTAALGGSHTVTSETIAGNDYWRLVMTFTTDDALGITLNIYPAIGANADLTTISAAAVGEITVLRQQLTPGTASGTYRKVEARQRVWDWSGNARHAVVGSAAGDTTNDPGDALWRKNLLADGSTEDLENAAWTATNATVDSATLMTFDAQHGKATQDCTTVDGVSYTLSFSVRRISGNTDLAFRHEESATAAYSSLTVTDVLTRYSVTVLGKSGGGIVLFGIQDRNAAGHGQIEVTEWQLEVGALTDYDASDRMVVAARGSFDGVDDYLDVASLALASDWSFVATIRPNDNTLRGLWRNGASSPNISLSESGMVSYAGGSVVLAQNVVGLLEWHTIGITLRGTTITHYLDGVVNGNGTSGSGNAFTALRIGYAGSTYYHGVFASLKAYSRALSAGEHLRVHRNIESRWNLDRRGFKNLNLGWVQPHGFSSGFSAGFTIGQT